MKLQTLDRVIFSSISGLMVILFVILVTAACGTDVKVKGGTTHESFSEVSGKVTTEVVLKIDVTACQDLDDSDKSQCIKDTVAAMGDLVELIKSLSTVVPK